MLRFTYLLINLGAVAVPLCFSFESRVKFFKKWRYFFPAMALVGLVFIVWDEWFTSAGVWGFNPVFITGIHIGHLPLEEILFFVCIPYACVFGYEVIRYYKRSVGTRWPLRVSWVILVTAAAVALTNYDRVYTFIMAASLAVVLAGVIVVIKPNYLGYFYIMYGISKVPFIVVNGILTNGFGARDYGPVVWYNETAIMGPRFLGIPVEDMGYSMLLLLLNVVCFEYFRSRGLRAEKVAGG